MNMGQSTFHSGDSSQRSRGFHGETDPYTGYREHGYTGLLVPVQDQATLKEFVKEWRSAMLRESLRSTDCFKIMEDYITSSAFKSHFSDLDKSDQTVVYRDLGHIIKYSTGKDLSDEDGPGEKSDRADASSEHSQADVEGSPNDPADPASRKRKKSRKRKVAPLENPHDVSVDTVFGRHDLDGLIDRCMSDQPEHQINDPKQYRVFTEEVARQLVRQYDNDKDDKKLIENMVRDMAANNGYRQRITPSEARKKRLVALLKTFPNFANVTQHVIEQMSSWPVKQPHARSFQPILLNGPKGCGKTAYAQALAIALDTEYEFVNLAASSMSGVLTGTSEKWSNGQPGLLFRRLSSGKSASPLVLLDEIDKISEGDHRFQIGGALLSVLEQETSQHLRDEFNNLQFDASQVIFLATCNDASLISPPIKSRFTTFTVKYPSPAQRRVIIANRLAKDYRNIELAEEALVLLSREIGDLRHLKHLIDRLVGQHVQAQLKRMGQGRAQTLKGKQVITEHTARQVLQSQGNADRLFDHIEA